MIVSTVFQVRNNPYNNNDIYNFENFSVEAIGQDACNAIRKANPSKKIILKGFKVNDKFIPVKL